MILVTGGAGFIGSNYIHQAIDQGKEIVCIDNLSYAANFSYIEPLVKKKLISFEKADIGDQSSLKFILKKYNPTYVINFAAETHVDNSIKNYKPFLLTNILGTVNLLECCLDSNIKKFVHISTDEIYGSLTIDEDRSFDEFSPWETNSPYSASKASGDSFVRAFYKTYGLPSIITHCSNNYGPNQHKEKLIPKIISNAQLNKKIPIYGNGENIRDWLFVEDHCYGIDLVLEKGSLGERYNIGGGTEISNNILVRKILNLMNKSEELIEYVSDRPGHDLRYSINCNKITTTLGYKPKNNLEDGLKKTINWYLNV